MAIRLSGIASGLDTDAMVQELVSAYSLKQENYEKQKTKLEWKQEVWKDLNKSIYGFYTTTLSNMRRAAAFQNKKNCNISDPTKATVSAASNVANGTQLVEIRDLAKASYLTGSALSRADGSTEKITTSTKLSDLGIANGTIKVQTADGVKEFNISADETIAAFTSRFQSETGVKMTFDANHKQFIMSSDSGAKNNFNMVVESADDYNTLASLGLATAEQKATYDPNYVEGTTPVAYKQDGTDATFIINGAKYTSESNSITVNGLTINATGITSGPITVTTTQDTDGMYKMIKEFITGYNDLINSITEKYNANTAKGYEPLTDEEKEAMSEDQIEKWEKKIKDSLLRRDGTLSDLMNTMTRVMAGGVEVGGEKMYLSDFGIATLGFMGAEENKYNAYHINGDAEDSNTADKTDKLRAMIESDPDKVADFFNELSKKMYDTLTDKMKSSSMRSAYTIYNDKQLDKEMKEIEDNISEWEDRVAEYEDYWYKKFTAMEQALTKLQAQTSQLASLLGTGQ